MKPQMIMRRLIAIFMIAGLVLAPLSRPVMAMTSATAGEMAAMSHGMASAADEMANDMPCCPSNVPAPIDCEKCLLMAACMTTGFAVAPMSASLYSPVVSRRVLRPQDDSWLQSLAHPPPDHPPRILI